MNTQPRPLPKAPTLESFRPPAPRRVRGVKPVADPLPSWAARVELSADQLAAAVDDDDEAAPALEFHLSPVVPTPKPRIQEIATMTARTPTPTPTPEAAEAPFALDPAPRVVEAPAAAVQAQASPDMASALSTLDALTGTPSALMLRIFATRPDGARGAIVATLPATESPDAIRARIERCGPGDYDVCLVESGRYVSGGSRRMTVEAAPAASSPVAQPVAAVVAAPGESGIAAMLERLAAMQAAAQASTEKLMLTMQAQARETTIETMKLALESRGGGGGGGSSKMMEMVMAALIPTLAGKLTEDPFDRMMKLQKLTAQMRDGADAPAPVWGQLASALAGAVSMAQTAQAAPARPAVQPQPPKPAAAAPAPAAQARPAVPARPLPEVLAEVVPIIKRLAAQDAGAERLLTAMSAILTEAEFEAVAPMLAQDGAADLLILSAPDLAPSRDWLSRVIGEAAAFIKSTVVESVSELVGV